MINFDNSFARDMGGFYLPTQGDQIPAPEMVAWNDQLAVKLGLQDYATCPEIWAGASTPSGASPLSMAYAGHQFGGFSPSLGDGRAMLLGELVVENTRYDIHLKGSGRTPFSRPGTDGKAALAPALREYLMGEAMYALGVPTTRAIAVVKTGEVIYRNEMKPGAVLTRVASSHLRVGTFEYFAARGEIDKLRQLADYTIARHNPELVDRHDKYLAFFSAVIERQARLLAKWMSIGFVHGVMNTDNMTISGETIDYGPCAFMDIYDRAAVFSSIDVHGRYAYGNQPNMAQWNLIRFGEALMPLLHEEKDEAVVMAGIALNEFADVYIKHWSEIFGAKLGIDPEHGALMNEFLELVWNAKSDFVQSFRALGDDHALLDLLGDGATPWIREWRKVAGDISVAELEAVNPVYVPRNHLVEKALQQAEAGDMTYFNTMILALSEPFDEKPGFEEFAKPPPEDFGRYVTYCGT